VIVMAMFSLVALTQRFNMRIPQQGDYIKTVSDRFGDTWRGKVRRQASTDMYLIEWSYTGGNSTDICTWVFDTDIVVVKRPKTKEIAICG
jgi:hypothetical protein